MVFRRFALRERVVGRQTVGMRVIDAILAVEPHSNGIFEVLLIHDVEEQPAVLLVQELVQGGEQLRIATTHRPSEGDRSAQRKCLADIGTVTQLDIEHVARGHRQIDTPFPHRRDQRLGLRILGRGSDVELQSRVAEPLQGVPVGAARAHRDGAPCEILDAENRIVIVPRPPGSRRRS